MWLIESRHISGPLKWLCEWGEGQRSVGRLESRSRVDELLLALSQVTKPSFDCCVQTLAYGSAADLEASSGCWLEYPCEARPQMWGHEGVLPVHAFSHICTRPGPSVSISTQERGAARGLGGSGQTLSCSHMFFRVLKGKAYRFPWTDMLSFPTYFRKHSRWE